MKKISGLIMVATAVILTACGGDDKKDSESLGESADSKREAMAGIIAGMENPALAFRLDINQLINKSGVKNNEGSSQMLDQGMMMLSALDLETPIRIAAEIDGNKKPWGVGLIGINDRSMFEAMVKGQAEMGKDVDGFKTAHIEAGGQMALTLGFNKHMCLVVIGEKNASQSEMEKQLGKFLKGAKSGKEPSGYFGDFIKGKEDFAIVYNVEPFLEIIPQDQMDKSGINLKDMKGMQVHATMDFINGEMVVTGNTTFPEGSEFSKMYGDGLDESYANYLTTDQFLGYLGTDFNIEHTLDWMMNLAKMDPDHKMEEKDMAMLNLIKESLTGELTIAMIDVNSMAAGVMASDEDMDFDIEDSFDELNDDESIEEEVEEVREDTEDLRSSLKKDAPKDILFTAGIKDRDLLSRMLDTMQNITLEDGIYASKNGEMFMVMLDDRMVMSGNKEVISKIKSGVTVTVEEVKPMLSSVASGYLDIIALVNALKAKTGQDEFDGSNYLELIEKVTLESNLTKSTLRVIMKDKNTNALEQFMNVILNANPNMLAGGMMM